MMNNTDDNAIASSRAATALCNFPAVQVHEAQGEHINPARVPPQGATLEVDAQGLQAGDRVTLHCAGAYSFSSEAVAYQAGEAVFFLLPARRVTANMNLWVTLTYLVERGGQQWESAPARFLVGEPFYLESTELILDGLSVKVAGWATTGVASVGNSALRPASGGRAPYSYVSSAPAVASVSSAGLVTGLVNGSATITATEQQGAVQSFVVRVSNVYRLVQHNGSVDHNQAVAWLRTVANGEACSFSAIGDMQRVYGRTLPTGNRHRWLCGKGGCTGTSFSFYHYTSHGLYCATNDNTNIRAAWCIQRT